MSREVEVEDDQQGGKRLVNVEENGAEPKANNRQEGERRSGDTSGKQRQGGGEVTLDKQTPLPKGVCHHCGKPGHIRPACPERARRSEQQVSVCYNCKKDGHKIADSGLPRAAQGVQ
jgi:hypothetical protein